MLLKIVSRELSEPTLPRYVVTDSMLARLTASSADASKAPGITIEALCAGSSSASGASIAVSID
jgi:hypothetical protein